MPITETVFWNEVERLDSIKTVDCPDSWLLMELDESLSNAAANELTRDQRWHIGMGCARCHRIMMLARITSFTKDDEDEPELDASPGQKVITLNPRQWRGTGRQLPLAAGDDTKKMFPVDFELDEGNIKIRIGDADEPGHFQVDVWCSENRTCVLRITDGVEFGTPEIVWPLLQLHANERTILPLSEENLKIYMGFKRADITLTEVQGK